MRWITCIQRALSIGECPSRSRVKYHLTFTLRDLKPENLLLDDAFRIKITDFGTGKLLEPGGLLGHFEKLVHVTESPNAYYLAVERAETFVGTPQYFSPELLESNETSKRSVPRLI